MANIFLELLEGKFDGHTYVLLRGCCLLKNVGIYLELAGNEDAVLATGNVSV